ncbi:MAG: SDR family NAD(P)-dependent oxidoreductase [Kiritimatiellia bacterium]
MSLPDVPRTAVVTGCSSGIGLSTARLLRERGWTVLPTARKPADLDMLRGEGFDPVDLDVADGASTARAADEILARAGGVVGALVNNAGFAQPGAMEDLTREALRRQFEVNVFGLQDLTNRLLPVMLKQKAGRIVNVSSVVGRVALPFLGIYSATKFAVEAMSDAMRVELTDSGVFVSLVEPGPIITRFRANAVQAAEGHAAPEGSRFKAYYEKELARRRKSQKKQNWINRPPEDVAVKIAHALESSWPCRRYPVTILAHVGSILRRFAPDFVMDWSLAKEVRRNLQA